MRLRKPSPVENLLTDDNKSRILAAIQRAETNTSGEIRVHIERTAKKQAPLDRAVEVFHELGMQDTELRNGVLVYVALDDRQFAIIGDEGINQKVGEQFWEQEKDRMTEYFQQGDIIGGIVYFIDQIGSKLQAYFPYQADDVNELSDDISVGE
ncbi:TPM domain-containing protein [candidate division KSB3 bacterium]|uniref:TPM domain-containing protein n=1 Tax=candidate division KSB3 bacterium TaxID=2044937 RepID=A0A9D5JVB2_9BACT|nr:TPM domain-containing protein [candidate division KSB3 bacterium]MBD3324820.1 TPM domain-containing protein [candidate division KSB3 bacterium]